MGANANVYMSTASAVQGVSSLASGVMNAQAYRQQGEFQRQQFEFNKRIAETQAEDAIRRGDKDAVALKKSAKRLIGAQRTALAAQGIEIDSGSALDVQMDTAQLAAQDALTIKNNAYREAWGYKVQALDYGAKGQFAELQGRQQATQSLLTGGLGALSNFGQAGYYAYGGDSRKPITDTPNSGVGGFQGYSKRFY